MMDSGGRKIIHEAVGVPSFKGRADMSLFGRHEAGGEGSIKGEQEEGKGVVVAVVVKQEAHVQ